MGAARCWIVSYINFHPCITPSRNKNRCSNCTNIRWVSVKLDGKDVAVYPNPTDASTTLSFNLDKSENLAITLKNIEGKEVKKIANHSFNAGKNEVSIDCTDLPKGLYFISIQSANTKIFKKLILQ